MTKDGKKTTIYISPDKMGPFYDLAAACGFTRANTGNITRLTEYIIELVEATDAATVAAALAGLGQEEGEHGSL